MTDREKLIELLKAADRYEFEETRNSGVYDREAAWGYIADHLLANGVTIPVKCDDCIHYEEPDEGDYLGVCRASIRVVVSTACMENRRTIGSRYRNRQRRFNQ